MATLILQAAGAAAGTFVGGPIGGMIGQAVGAVAGAAIDRAALAKIGQRNVAGPRLTRMPGINASEGASIARVFGKTRTGGTVIWMTRFEETVTVTRAGGAGGKGGGPKARNFKYAGNFAIGICEGEVAEVRRIWADGVEIDRTRFNIRIHKGTPDQQPNPLIVAKEGAESAPAYRGICYAVFERMPLEAYGNRIPQLSFEVIRPVASPAQHVRSVCVIPGSSEFAYSPAQMLDVRTAGVSRTENRHVLTHSSDWNASIEALQALCPQLESVSLVVSWFGTDLRAQYCQIEPRVEDLQKRIRGMDWSVAGLTRAMAHEVSRHEGRSAFGGTPSDDSVLAAIADLKSRGLKVVFYPFVMMDIAQSNTLPDPWSNAPQQAAYPWRGRVTCDPAPDRPATVDATAFAAQQIDAFFGPANPSANDFCYRRFILHYANLCAQAGGVDAFLIGSELVSLTRVRSAPGQYPAADRLASLAQDVKAILPQAKLSYAADWTEYGAHVRDGGQEVGFPLDSLWASPHVDFVGIDAYWPLTDWRDGDDHLDRQEATSIHDTDFLQKRIASGEGYDWYYASKADRDVQNRLPITDGAYGKPWVFRQKDIHGWWANPHVPRLGGVETGQPTSWTPQSKPIWFTETGCPAVDRGANAPNVFPDPKSSESALPWYSRGSRDDLMQWRYIEAWQRRFDPQLEGHVLADNPVSAVYGGRMVDPARISFWAWDARPWPAFPTQTEVWADGQSWLTGHWLNGRLESVDAGRLAQALALQASGLESFLAPPAVDALVEGYLLEGPVTPRAAIETLAQACQFETVISGGRLEFRSKARAPFLPFDQGKLVALESGALFEIVSSQESELDHEVSVSFSDPLSDYRPLTVYSRRVESLSRGVARAELPVTADSSAMQRAAESILGEIWSGRDSIRFMCAPSQLHLEAGGIVTLDAGSGLRRFQITRIIDANTREIEARSFDKAIYEHAAPLPVLPGASSPAIAGPPRVETLDLAIARGNPPALQYVAVFADPWPGAMALWRSGDGESFEYMRQIDAPAVIGETLETLMPGPAGLFDRGNTLAVRIPRGALASVSDTEALAGKNTFAIRGADGAWEIFSAARAELVSPQTWRLSRLVRGLGGEGHLAGRSLAAGATIVLLDEAVVPLVEDAGQLGLQWTYRVGPVDSDHSDGAYTQFSAVAGRQALLPYAPVKVTARRTGAGVEISFLRRSRINADNWEPVEIPLGEDISAFEIDVMNGAALKRTFAVAQSPAIYPASQELADFGAPQTSLSLRIHQMSAMTGRGYPFAGNVAVT